MTQVESFFCKESYSPVYVDVYKRKIQIHSSVHQKRKREMSSPLSPAEVIERHLVHVRSHFLILGSGPVEDLVNLSRR